MGTCTVLSYILKYSPMVGAEAQEVLSEEVRSNPRFLKFVPDVFKNQEMCINAIGAAPWLMLHVPPHFRTRKMFERVIEKYLHSMRDAPDHLKTQEMCEKAVEKSPYQLDDRFEEKGFVEHSQLVDIPRDVLYALAMPASQE